MRAAVREQVDAAIEAWIEKTLAQLPPMTAEARREAVAILDTVQPRRRDAAA